MALAEHPTMSSPAPINKLNAVLGFMWTSFEACSPRQMDISFMELQGRGCCCAAGTEPENR
jgi:hypothetical protein